MMEKYRLVEEHKESGEEFLKPKTPYEIRITQQGKPKKTIAYAIRLFAEGSNTVVLKAMGRSISKAVTIAEILKRKIPLHQVTSLDSVEMTDVFAPIEEGLDVVTSTRHMSCMTITLSRDGKGMDPTDIGYQPPLSNQEMAAAASGNV